MILDADDKVMGRVASHAAEQALLGKDVHVVNVEEAIITGSKQDVMDKYRAKRERGAPRKGPFFPKQPEQFFKRIVRGMLPYKTRRGEEALARVKCHIGEPDIDDERVDGPDEADVSKLTNLKYVRVKEVCEELGAKL